MRIELSVENVERLKKHKNATRLVNQLLSDYLSDKIIPREQVVGMFMIRDVYKKSYLGPAVHECAAAQFKGVVIERRSDSESIFIPNEKLCDALERNCMVAVLESVRLDPIDVQPTNFSFHPLSKEEYF